MRFRHVDGVRLVYEKSQDVKPMYGVYSYEGVFFHRAFEVFDVREDLGDLTK